MYTLRFTSISKEVACSKPISKSEMSILDNIKKDFMCMALLAQDSVVRANFLGRGMKIKANQSPGSSTLYFFLLETLLQF